MSVHLLCLANLLALSLLDQNNIVGTPPINSLNQLLALFRLVVLNVYQTGTKLIFKINLVDGCQPYINWYSYWNFTCWYTANIGT